MYEKINISVLYACLDKTIIIIIISIIIIVMELNNSSASSFYDFTKFYLLHKSLDRREYCEMLTKMIAAE